MRKLLFLLIPFFLIAQPAKYGTSTHWISIQVKGANVYVADTNVPTVVGKTSMGDVIAGCSQADGQDIVVTTAAGVAVPRTITSFSKTDSTFQMHYRDPATHATTGGTLLYIQWGGASLADDATTWASNYGGSIDHVLVVHGEETSADLTDESGNYTATDASITYNQTGKISKAPSFNGGSSVSSWGDITELNLASKLTFSLWVSQDILDVVDILFNKYSAGSGNYIQIQTDAAGFLSFINRNSAVGTSGKFDYSTRITAGQFAFINLVWDGTQASNGLKMKMYVDNNGAETLTFFGTLPTTTADLSSINLLQGHAGLSLDGEMDEVKILTGALSQNQIKGQYDNQDGFATNATLTIGGTSKFSSSNLHGNKQFRWNKAWQIWSRRKMRFN